MSSPYYIITFFSNLCKNCGKPNHFAVCCQESKKKVLSKKCEPEDEEYVAVIKVEKQLNTVASAGNRNQVFTTLLVNGKEEKFQLDSGSTVSIMADKTVKALYMYGENGLDDLVKTSVTLVTVQIGDIRPPIDVLNPSAKNGLTRLRFPNGF